MRIVGGKYKGRRFNPPKKFPSRPTTDFAKEALFNILENRYYFEDLSVLDLFSGTGNIGAEFLSRGAQNILSVDKHPVSHRFILQMIAKLGDDKWQCVKRDAFRFCTESMEQFDLIFADPPYGLKGSEKLPEIVFENNLLRPGGLFIMEHDQKLDLNGTHLQESRKYGGVCFSFFEHDEKSS